MKLNSYVEIMQFCLVKFRFLFVLFSTKHLTLFVQFGTTHYDFDPNRTSNGEISQANLFAVTK